MQCESEITRMKKSKIEICSLDFLLFAYEQRLEEEEMLDEGYIESFERLSVAEMRECYAGYLRGLASD